jgi:predicted Zn-dependent protease
VLYAVIAAGPGWDSDTMNNLYGDDDTYQKQFKALKDYVAKDSDAGYGHFVLAYHYLAQGRKSAAVKELKEVTRTQPDDKLSAELLKVLAA